MRPEEEFQPTNPSGKNDVKQSRMDFICIYILLYIFKYTYIYIQIFRSSNISPAVVQILPFCCFHVATFIASFVA